jgi:hypothetical protein
MLGVESKSKLLISKSPNFDVSYLLGTNPYVFLDGSLKVGEISCTGVIHFEF